MGTGGQGDVWTKSALTLVTTICVLIFYRSLPGVMSFTTWHHPVKFHCFVFCVASTAVYFPDACLYFWMSSVLFGDTAKWEPSENSDSIMHATFTHLSASLSCAVCICLSVFLGLCFVLCMQESLKWRFRVRCQSEDSVVHTAGSVRN